jgi:hypothetical protein
MSERYNNYFRNDLGASNFYIEDESEFKIVNRAIKAQPIYNIKTIEDAYQFIDERLDNSNILDVARIFYSYKHKEINLIKKKINKQQGGIDYIIEQFKLYKLLTIADSIHDFGDAAYDIEELEEYLPNEITKEDILEFNNNTASLSFSESKFIEALSKNMFLTFKDDNGTCLNPIKNVFYNIDISNYPIDKKTIINNKVEYESLYRKYIQTINAKLEMPDNRNISLEIWSSLDDDPKRQKKRNKIEICQLANICSTIAKLFREYDNGNYNFQVDNQNNDAINMIVSTKLLNTAFHHKINLYSKDKLSYSTQEIINYMINEYETNNIIAWNLTTSDANIFDPADNNPNINIDSRPTGDIYNYSEMLNYQVTLNGVNADKTVNIELHPELGTLINKTYSKTLSKFIFRIGTINGILGRNKASTKTNTDPNEIEKRTYIPYTKEFKIALKRAGDWSQVMHAKKYKKIFVTSDRLATLFAIYNNVPYILFREDHYYSIPTDKNKQRPDLLQISFVLGYS